MDRSIDWLIDCSMDWLIDCSMDWLIDCSMDWLIDCSMDWSIDCLIACFLWNKLCFAVTLKEFSAVCWAFGRRLQEKLQIPIGLIGTYYGGTPIRAWSDPATIAHCDNKTRNGQPPEEYDYNFHNPGENSVLWNAMIYPLLPLNIKGVIWYQGEADAAGDFNGYRCMFPSMIGSWRGHFRQPDLPFGFVQLADNKGEDIGTPIVRWHQTVDVGYVPNQILHNVFMAVAMDLPDNDSPTGA